MSAPAMSVPDMLQQLPQLEAMCTSLFTAQAPDERSQAERVLAMFSSSTEYLPHCKAILDNSRSQYAWMLASTSLLKLLTEHPLSPAVRMEMKSYLMGFLSTHSQGMENYTLTNLVAVVCRAAKLAWFDQDTARGLVDDCKALLDRGEPAAYQLGLKLLQQLVTEMNTTTPGRTLTQHRKVAVSFRDLALLKVIQTALAALRFMLDSSASDELKKQGLALALSCLSYDFVGTCLDDSTEDLSTIQVPASWRSLMEEPATVQLFFDYYAATSPPLSSTALECLVRLASVRRSLFASEVERSKFLNRLVGGTREVMAKGTGLSQHENYHELCRLLGRLKTNFQLTELVSVDQYEAWIQLVAELTIKSLHSWQWAAGSVYFLLGLWSRLVSSMPYLKGDSPSLLEANVPRITQAYITSRLQSVSVLLAERAPLDELLEGEEQLAEQLESLPYLCRFQYDRSAQFVLSIIDPLIEQYRQAMEVTAPTQDQAVQLSVIEGQLAWMVFIIGSVIRGRLTTSMGTESSEATDGDLASRVFSLLPLMDQQAHAQRYAQPTRQRLDIAVVNFLQCFRKVYIGEQVMHSSKVYRRLGERVNLPDHLALLNAMLAKIATNLRTYGQSEQLVHLTLTLFQDLSQGYMSGKLLLKLDAINFMLANHTSAQYPFLDVPINSCNRTMYYATLARLLFTEDTPARFNGFVAPLQQVLVSLGAACSSAPTAAALRAMVPQGSLVGLFRDLRGIATATNSRRTYGLLFDWLYPQHFPAILRCLEAYADVPAVTTPLLKFVAEFCYNKSQRLTFDSSSPNGILLFREVSKVIVTYGRSLLADTRQPVSLYNDRYKGTWICLQALSRAMSGNYVNFGVFELYGDRALVDALEVALRLALQVPLADIMSYKKLSKAYFSLLEVLCQSHANLVARQDTPTFTFLLTSMEQGLKSLDVAISSSCASAVDHLAAFYFKNVVQPPETGKPAPGAVVMQQHLAAQPSLLPELLRTLFEAVLFEECSNQWSLSRPMLSLILVNEQIYDQLKAQIIASQPPEKQAHLSACLAKLMADVGRNLEPKNRDKFTQNLTIVRHDYRSKS